MKLNENTPLNFVEKMNSKISLISSFVVLAVLVLVFYRIDYVMIRRPANEAQKQEKLASEQGTEETVSTAPEISKATVIAVGDNLYHGSLLEKGKNNNWNYDSIYDHVRDRIQEADLAIVDQETVLTTDHNSISSYPSFATPTEVGDALVNAGFDVIETATNHIDDYTSDYIEQTLNFWKTSHPEITLLGIHESEEDAQAVKIREVNGIKIAFLDYTYGTNNSGAGEGKEYMIDMFNVGSEAVGKMIQKAKAEADCVIFIAHWGTEDEPMPNEYEKQWSNFLMKQGVDVVIGGHPHVLQPYGHLTDEEGHDMVIFYSLGNFVSTQRELPELLGGMGCFTIQKTVQNNETTIEILDPTVKPLVMHYNSYSGDMGPYMLEDYNDSLAQDHTVNEYIDTFSVTNLNKKFKEIMSMRVTPSTGTSMLNVSFNWEGSMLDPNGNIVEDYDSVSALQYYANLGVDVSSTYYSDTEVNYTPWITSDASDVSSDSNSDLPEDSY